MVVLLLHLGLVGVSLIAFLALAGGGALWLLHQQDVKWSHRRGTFPIPALLIGEKEHRERLTWALSDSPSVYSLIGELDPPEGQEDLARLGEMLVKLEVRNVILVGDERLTDEEFLDRLRSEGMHKVNLQVVPRSITLLDNKPVLSGNLRVSLFKVSYTRLYDVQRALKRVLDIVGALLGLVLLSPLLLVVALVIKLTSKGPVFFRQERVGTDEKTFACLKFRSMYEDAGAQQAKLDASNEADWAIRRIMNEPLRTPVGLFIRRYSIDELPQLINVLKGEMSLVGPRPLPLQDSKLVSELHKQRFAAIPGITGYWQVSGRNNLSFDDMVRLDLYYIENWTLWLDIKILIKTVGVVLRCEGAY